MTTEPRFPDPRARDAAFDRLVRRRGFATRQQLDALGYSASAISRRKRSGRWNEFVPGSWAPASTLPTIGDRERAVAAWLGDLATVSHLSAAQKLRIPAPKPTRAWISVPFTLRVEQPPLVRLHRTRHPPMPWWAGDLRVTEAARTVVDLGQLLDRDQLTAAMTHVLRERMCTLAQIEDELAELTHKAGTGLVREVVTELSPGFESYLEIVLGKGFARCGMQDLQPQLHIVDPDGTLIAIADFADKEARLLYEADGWAAHGSPAQQARDRRRDAALLERGWQTVRYGTDDILRHLSATLAQARSIRASRRALLGLPPAPCPPRRG
ncbi:MAG TPA: type IV toxin-antitoxin system AbiEi family antitoxin domain-containing protein [Jiangellales bacterium]|nr:type IV toxin-antitoxin system AbiEi family antitoxin domain-containing protein [Jiangellales bacterium]